MMQIYKNYFTLGVGLGCSTIAAFVIIVVPLMLFFAPTLFYTHPLTNTNPNRTPEIIVSLATNLSSLFSNVGGGKEPSPIQQDQQSDKERAGSMAALYQAINPGVVSIRVYGQEEGFSTEKDGTGFILNENGHIVTNYHIMAGAEQVMVGFYNKQEAEAEIMGVDKVSDLAVIKVDKLVDGAHPLLLGDSDDVVVGDWVIAIGNPLGQPGSLSVGIASGVDRIISAGVPDFVIPGAIQTDADMNLGSSGGPLLNLQGEVIGLNTQIGSIPLVPGSGIGFATPINLVQRVVPILMKREIYPWPWLGAQGRQVYPALMQANNLESQQGAYIDVVIPNSPAAKAGLQGTSTTKQIDHWRVPVGGDVVVAVDGQLIVDFNDLLAHVARKELDDEIELTIRRDSQLYQVRVKLEPQPLEVAPVGW